MISEEEIAKSHKNIVWCQCTGLLTFQCLYNGFLLNFIKKFGIDDGITMLLLTFIPNLFILVLTLPLAHLSDKKGMKKIGLRGNWLQVLGFTMLILAYFFDKIALPLFIVSIVIYAFGFSLFQSNWFALIDPLIKPETRGRFFAVLRIKWQVVAIVVTFIVTALIGYSDSKEMYLGIILFFSLMAAWRILFYNRIPELIKPNTGLGNIGESWQNIKKNKEYMKFCWYFFCMTFLSSGLLPLFNLFEKGSLNFSESQIVAMGVVNQVGALVGFWAGAQIVDRKGNEILFTFTNLAKLSIVAFFAFIQFLPVPTVITAGVLTFSLGVIVNAFGIGTIAEALKRVPPGEKSFGIGLSMTMAAAGGTLASLVSSQYLKFAESLTVSLGSFTLNHYEIYLFCLAIGFLLVTVIFRFKSEESDESV